MTEDHIDQAFDETLTRIAADLAADGGPLTVSTVAACILLNHSASYLRRLIQAGKLESPVPGQITARSIAAMLRVRMAKSPYREAQTRLMAERARISELKRRQMEAALVATASVENAWSDMVALVRTRILQVPKETALAVAAATEAAQVASILGEAIDRALHELSRTRVVVDPN